MSRWIVCDECDTDLSHDDLDLTDPDVACPVCDTPLDLCDDYGDYDTASYDGPFDERSIGPVTPTGGSIR